ncbi:PA14 domain-containing protein [Nocardia amamiensis]|uniref:PA14 domain-containing protein n=1 Tax=Nocardia amamiensis TaxID=404578 RepID=UPI0008334CA5|nr:PA14 domain-containing protein [Nocardia amamiensis]
MKLRSRGRIWIHRYYTSFLHLVILVVAVALGVSLARVWLSPPAPPAPKTATEVPVLNPAKGPEPRQLEPESAPPAADFAPLSGAEVTATGVREGFDPATSVEESRTEKSVTYRNANGSRSVVLHQAPVSVRDDQGGWVAMDTSLIAGQDAAVVSRDGANTRFSAFADDPALMSVDTGTAPVSISLNGAQRSRGVVEGSTVLYPDVLNGQDLQYTVEPGAVKESVIVKDVGSVGEGRWVFTMKLGDGLTPRLENDGVLITDARGAQVAALPPIEVFDSAGEDRKTVSARTGGRYSLDRAGEAWELTVAVDTKWLTDEARVFPITVDPTYTYGFGNTAETRAYNSTTVTECVNTCGIAVGNSRPNNTNQFWRSTFRFDLAPLFGKSVIGARIDFKRTGATGTAAPATSNLYQAANPLGYNANGPLLASAPLGDAGTMFSSALTGFLAGKVTAGDNTGWFLLTGGETDAMTYKTLQASLIVDYGTPPPAATLAGPADESVIATTTPTLSVDPVTNPSGDGTTYCFKVSTGFDGRSGSVVDSGCLDNPSWTVPKNILHDGGKYTWTVLTALKGGVTTTTPQWVGHFTINQRTGETGESSNDRVGPVTVNLYNGNVHTEAGGPEFDSLGGKSGIGLAYNSRQGEPGGIRASYFNDSTHTGTPDAVPVLVRTEPTVNLDWGNIFSQNMDNVPWRENPLPTGLNSDWYVVRWEGHFKATATGDYRFGGLHAEGAKIWVNNQLVYDNPNSAGLAADFTTVSAKQPGEVSLTVGQRVPIKVELYHRTTEKPKMVLWTKSTDNSGFGGARAHNIAPQVVKTEWLYSADLPSLPAGWTLSMQGSGYTDAESLDGSIVLTDATGAKHTWVKTSTGGYAPPVGEDGVLAVDTAGRITVTEGDLLSVFNADGTLAMVSSVLDSKKPSALQYNYSGALPRLTEVRDPVSGRSHTLYYNTDNSNSCYGGATKPPGKVMVADGYNGEGSFLREDVIGNAPNQMLCRIKYWDGTETRLWYSIAGTLDRIENPGGDIRDYSYEREATAQFYIAQYGLNNLTSQNAIAQIGPINQVRSSLATDWLARQSTAATPAEVTSIAYTSVYDYWAVVGRDAPGARPDRIWAPAPDGRTLNARGMHIYQWGAIGQNVTKVNLAGAGVSILPAKTVTFDGSGRVLSEANANDVTARMEWNAKDKPTAVIDTTGRRTTRIYDHADRLTDTYGPAPAACFDGQLPTAACAATIPHQHIGYDEGMRGLQAQLYDNPSLSGKPAVWQTGIGTPDGSLAATWGADPPVANSGGWSARFSGEMQFPASGTYTMGSTAVDGVRLWIDDVSIIDSWSDKALTTVTGTYTNTTPGAWHRVRVEYYNRAGNTGALDLTWKLPGAQDAVTVPGQALAPRYGLHTTKTADNSSDPNAGRAPSRTVRTSYSDPANGIDPVLSLVTAVAHDPDGANLVRRTRFEQPGQGYLRQLAQALPGGDVADAAQRATYSYYGDTETRANPCDAQSTAVSQAGMVRTIASAANSGGSSSTAEIVYDAAGRVVASRIDTQPWSCKSFDARGRLTREFFPAVGAEAARTVTYDYAVNGDPLVQRVSDESGSTTSVVDLVGQVVSYTDTNGVVTTNLYDSAGRKTRATSVVKGVTSTLNYQWDNATQLTKLTLDGVTVATPSYNAGILVSAAYGNGSTLGIGRNDAGTISSVTWNTGGTTVSDTVVRARDQRIVDDTISDSAGGTFHSSYTYDGVGRLTAATVPHHQLTYAFDGADGCGPDQNAGLNSNRTSFSDSFDGAPAAVTNYCYDGSDRLLSTNGATALAFEYDAYGNTTKIGGDTLGYDSTRRHAVTTTAAGTSIRYARDVNDRIMARTVQTGGTTAQTRYGYTAADGVIDFVLDGDGNLLQRVVRLSGGVVLTKTYTGAKPSNYAYPNIHGDIMFNADGAGTRTGSLHLYDPYGQNIDPVTGVIGDIPIPETATGGMDFGYLGEHIVPVEHLAGQQALEMGARTYLPVLGRFLQTDPVSGGSANDYDYVNADPINSHDLTGKQPEGSIPRDASTAAGAVLLVVGALGLAAEASMAAGNALGNILMKVAEALADNYEPGATPPNKDQVLAETGRQIGEAAKAAGAAGGSVSGYIGEKITELELDQRDAVQVALAAAKAAFPENGGVAMTKNGDVAVLPTYGGKNVPVLLVSPDGSVQGARIEVYPGPDAKQHEADVDLYSPGSSYHR